MAAGGAPASPKPRSRAPSADLSAEMEKLDEDLMVTKRFLGKVRHFFRLLDANGDGVIEVGEARSRLRVVLLNPDSGMSPQVVKRRLSAGARPQDMKGTRGRARARLRRR
jgi:Ca2+-binding EF-hand superfamily protein